MPSSPGAQPCCSSPSPSLDAALAAPRAPARNQRWSKPSISPGKPWGRGQPTFREPPLGSRGLRHRHGLPCAWIEAGGSHFHFAKGSQGKAPSLPGRDQGSTDERSTGNSMTALRRGGHSRCPTLNGKNCTSPSRVARGSDPARLGGCRCRHRSGTGTAQVPAARRPPGGPARLGNPLLGALGNSPAAEQLAACLPACARSCAMCAEPGSPARTPRSALPPCRPLPSHPLEKKLSELPGMKSRAVVAVKTIQQAGWYILELR